MDEEKRDYTERQNGADIGFTMNGSAAGSSQANDMGSMNAGAGSAGTDGFQNAEAGNSIQGHLYGAPGQAAPGSGGQPGNQAAPAEGAYMRSEGQSGGSAVRPETGFQMVDATPEQSYRSAEAPRTTGSDTSDTAGRGQEYSPSDTGRLSQEGQMNSQNDTYRMAGGAAPYDNNGYQTKSGPGPEIYYGGGGGNGQQPPKKKRSGSSQLVAIILVIILAVGCGFGGGVAAMYFVPEVFGGGGASGSSITITPDSKMDTAEAIAAKVMPSVVGISTQSVQNSPYAQLFGMGQSIMEGVGTGIIVDENGYILTNSHVVNDGDTKSIKVQFYDGTEKDGSVLWSDKSLDLAIVKVDAKNLTAAELGDSDEVNIGAYAVAIGNPLGLEFQRSVTQGIVSGLDRSITVSEGNGSTTMDGLIQTDASINSGNSGGPLLNSRGQVIGINSAKVQSGEGLGFAIPINTAKPIIEEIKEKGEFTRAYIGIEAFGLGDYSSSYPTVNLKDQLGTDEGIYVQNVTAGGGAEAAGVQNGDVITELNGEKVTSMNNLNTKLIKYRPGEKVKLTVIRDKKSMEIEVTLKAGATV